MAKIGIVTDSTADIPLDLVENLGITVVPLTIHTQKGNILDQSIDIDSTNEEMYEYLRNTPILPTTSQPSPSAFIQAYTNCIDNGADVIFSVHLSSQLSGTVNGARMAAQKLQDKCDIRVFDSLSATMGLGLLVVLLARKAHVQDDVEQLDIFLQDAIKKMKIYFLLDSLDNLEKGGRIGKASYLVGSILNIKPLLILHNGIISAHKKIRGNKDNRAISELVQTVVKEVNDEKRLYIAIGYNDNKLLENEVSKALQKEYPDLNIEYFRLGRVVSTHIGLGAVGIAFFQ